MDMLLPQQARCCGGFEHIEWSRCYWVGVEEVEGGTSVEEEGLRFGQRSNLAVDAFNAEESRTSFENG